MIEETLAAALAPDLVEAVRRALLESRAAG
jgi:hypothetical protein